MRLKSKQIILSATLLLSLSLMVGCSSNDTSQSSNTSSSKENNKDEKVLVTDIEFVDAKILDPDSIGTRYFKTSFKNNSDKTITSIGVEFKLDNGDIAYVSSYDTLKPGDTSSIAECFASTTGKIEDMEAKKVSITAINGDKQLYIDYDVKLDKYDVFEGEIEEQVQSPVLVKDIEVLNATVLEPDSIGSIYMKANFKNNSKLPITSISIELELDNGEVSYLSSYDTLLPGDTSSNVECFGPTTGKLEDIKAKKISIVAVNEAKKDIYIDYDIKLNKYDVTESVD